MRKRLLYAGYSDGGGAFSTYDYDSEEADAGGHGRERPSPSAVQPVGAEETGSFACLCQNQDVVEAVLNSLKQEAKKKNSKLESYEIPLAIDLEPAPWLPETGLVTPTLKLKRPTN